MAMRSGVVVPVAELAHGGHGAPWPGCRIKESNNHNASKTMQATTRPVPSSVKPTSFTNESYDKLVDIFWINQLISVIKYHVEGDDNLYNGVCWKQEGVYYVYRAETYSPELRLVTEVMEASR